MNRPLCEIAAIYARTLGVATVMLLLFGLVQAVAWAWRRHGPRAMANPSAAAILRRLPLWLTVGLALLGVTLAIREASLVDDAYISFHYARHFAEGHGLVFNLGERVEGYTNFLWTLLLGLLVRLTRGEAPVIALVLTPLCFVLNVLVIYRLGRRLNRDPQPRVYVPLAAMLFAVQNVAVGFATTGMETMFATLLINLGVLFLIAPRGARTAALSGLMFILATLTRPDLSIFYVVGGLTLLRPLLRSAEDRRAAWWTLPAYAAPFLLYGGYLVWKWGYYGALLPNTFYSRSVMQPYLDQGVLYAAAFYLASHFWLLASLLGGWAMRRARSIAVKRFKFFAVTVFLVFNAYIVWVGGDFMYGRFFVPLIGLVLLGVENLVYSLAAHTKRPVCQWVVAGLMVCTAHGTMPIRGHTIKWHMAYENSYYYVSAIRPIEINHEFYRDAKELERLLTARGLTPAVATTNIGMIGYYSRLPVVDYTGLTEPAVAHQPTAVRARPGHEKYASFEHMWQRQVRLFRHEIHPPKYQPLADIMPRPWCFLVYDRALVRQIREKAPEIAFTDFEQYLDNYLAAMPTKSVDEIRADLAWFRAYYFDHNDDAPRLGRIEAYLAGAGSPVN